MNLVSKPMPAATSQSSPHDTGHDLTERSPPHLREAWRQAAIALGVSMLAVLLLFSGTARGMVEIWYRSPTFNHGFMVPLICGYLIWRQRDRLLSTLPRPSMFGLVGVTAAAFVWLLGEVADVMLVQQFALVGIIQLLCFSLLGWSATRIIAFPLFYLLFAVPVGEFLVQPLQDFTAVFVVMFLQVIGIPVFLDGVFISIPTGNFEVAAACSGMRFLIASVALGFVFAHLSYRSVPRRAAFVGLSIVVPIIANGMRAFGIVYIAYATNNTVAVGIDHLIYGWIFFSVVTVVLLAIGMSFRDEVVVHAGAAPAAAPPDEVTSRNRSRLVITAVAGVLIVVMAPVYASLTDRAPTTGARVLLAAPGLGGGWQRRLGYHDAWMPSFPGADDRLRATYVKDGKAVHLFMAYYVRQRQGAELVGGGNSMAGGDRWARAQSGQSDAMLEDRPLRVSFDRLVRSDRNRLVWHWFWVGGEFTANRYRAKLLEAGSRLLGGARPGAAIAVATEFTFRRADAEAVLRDFIRNLSMLRPMLERSGGR